MSSIVIYFSRSGENYFGGVLKNIEKGNTEVIAEYIQELDNSQNFNRYSYCLNNPLKYNDPSGEFFATILNFIKDFVTNT
ncbi:MAG: hypothetical protein J6W16_02200, partial [Methanobrevibacter sp.]|nr:hypothetical protein [Methanobrevibacter sp.]